MLNPDLNLADNLFDDPDQVPQRNGYGDGVVEAGEKNKNIVVLCCDLTESTRSLAFKKAFPERFVEMGIAEQNMAGIAAGMAFSGKIPYIASYATFSPGRNWDQIRVSICYSMANVKIMGAHAGISVGPDGATHQALEDIAITRCLPNMMVIVPCDYWEAKKATIAISETNGPVYMRFGREKVPVVTTEKTPFEVGRAEIFKHGKDVTVIACGSLVYESLIAAGSLSKEGIDVRVINCHTIKPIDEGIIINAAKETGAIVTAEEHQVHGGLGSAVAEVVSKDHPVPIEFVAIMDRFGESGEPDELMTKFGVKSRDIIIAVNKVLKRK
ncbi:transketolase family protein [Desulfobacterota bacterium AH_259_B03_O07]|nr:transketolase family protein [Desulfobacterota bacterium AH_259_B03_O07]